MTVSGSVTTSRYPLSLPSPGGRGGIIPLIHGLEAGRGNPRGVDEDSGPLYCMISPCSLAENLVPICSLDHQCPRLNSLTRPHAGVPPGFSAVGAAQVWSFA